MLTITVDTGPDEPGLKLEAQLRTDLAELSSRNLHTLASRFTRFIRRSRKLRSRPELAMLFLLLSPALANAAELKPVTLRAWDAYVSAAKRRMEERASGRTAFLWVDEGADLAQRVRAGEVLAEPVDGHSPHTVPHGLIHGWIGAMFVSLACYLSGSIST
jgi:hypothetical protein